MEDTIINGFQLMVPDMWLRLEKKEFLIDFQGPKYSLSFYLSFKFCHLLKKKKI